MDTVLVMETIAQGGAAVGVVYLGIKHGKKTMLGIKERMAVKKAQTTLINELILSIPQMREQLSVISKEIRPNGGSSIRDVVDRIEARQIIRDQTNEAQMSAIGLAYWRSDAEGRCTYASPSLCRMLGTNEAGIKGNNWASLIHPDDRAAVSDEWQRSGEENRVFNMTYRFVREDNGETITVRGHATPLINSKTGDVEGFWGHASEITPGK